MTRVTAVLHQWCGLCQDYTPTVPCTECGAPYFACGRCGYHHGHETDDD